MCSIPALFQTAGLTQFKLVEHGASLARGFSFTSVYSDRECVCDMLKLRHGWLIKTPWAECSLHPKTVCRNFRTENGIRSATNVTKSIATNYSLYMPGVASCSMCLEYIYFGSAQSQCWNTKITVWHLDRLQNASASAIQCSMAFCVDRLQRWPHRTHKVHHLSVRSLKIKRMGSLYLTECSERKEVCSLILTGRGAWWESDLNMIPSVCKLPRTAQPQGAV